MADKSFGVKQINLIGASGTPTIESPNNLNLNATTVAISTDVTIGGQVQSDLKIGPSYSVGVGTTNPTAKLDVNGTVALGSSVYDANGTFGTNGQVLSNVTGFGVSWTDASGGGGGSVAGSDGQIQYNNGGSFGGASQLYYDDANDRVGINTSTPTAKLDVNGTLNVTGVSTISVNSASDALRITQTGTGNALVVEDSANPDQTAFVIDNEGRIGVGTDNPNGHGLALFDTSLQITSGEGGALPSGLTLSYQPAFDAYYILNWFKPLYIGGGADVILQPSANNVGIGSTIPTAKLDVNGTVALGSSVYDANGTFGTNGQVLSNVTGFGVSWTDASGGGGGSVAGSDGQIQYNNGGSFGGASQLYYDDANDRVGINTSTPTAKLDVVGDVKVLGVVTATDFNSTSDVKLKVNIQPIEDPLSKVLKIQGVSFNWIKDNKPSMGVIADEVQKILPELVSDTDPKTVNYNGLIGLLIEVVKEQDIKIKSLENRISKLE